MDISVYSDESGTFDCIRGRYYVFGGIIFLSPDKRENFSRRYSALEKIIRSDAGIDSDIELKATTLDPAIRNRLFDLSNHEYRFGIIINIQGLRIRQDIAYSPKDKQRFLDFSYKIAIKRFFQYLIQQGTIVPNQVRSIRFYIDQHTTATNGRYELQDALEREFKNGTISYAHDCKFPPLFTNLNTLKVAYLDSKHVPLIRTADIIANRIYQKARSGSINLKVSDNFHVFMYP